MARKRFYNLKRPKIRASWNKVNLYNLWRQEPLRTRHQTFFQQKWAAKSHSRAYHGEHIREKQWQRQFSRYIPAVVPMKADVLAKTDGSDMAAGRGSGRISKREALGQQRKDEERQLTPYMQGVFWPQEKRLDVAVWRALFASSARQARQFVVHGFVKVNGKRMRYPGYLLNPGDMFSVDPEMVLFATGGRPQDKPAKGAEEAEEEDTEAKKQAQTDRKERLSALRSMRTRIVDAIALESPEESSAQELHQLYLQLLDTSATIDLKDSVDDALANLTKSIESEDDFSGENVAAIAEETVKERKKALKDLRSDIDLVLGRKGISGPRKRELRSLYGDAGKALSRVAKFEDSTFVDEFRQRLSAIEGRIDASERGLTTLPDGTVIDPSRTSADIADLEAAVAEQTDALSSLQSCVRWTQRQEVSTIQNKALDDLLRRIETALTTLANISALPDESYDPQLLNARYIAIVGPSAVAESEKSAPRPNSTSDAAGKRAKKFLSPHMERLSRLSDFQSRMKKALSYVPLFQRKWAEEDATTAATALTTTPTDPTAPQTVAPPPSPPAPTDQSHAQIQDKSHPEIPAYLTPWRPRAYMSAFAFIPRYLEVNQNVCSAVYLRDPVVRPGRAEVPSPFAPETGQLIFNWYLRRR